MKQFLPILLLPVFFLGAQANGNSYSEETYSSRLRQTQPDNQHCDFSNPLLRESCGPGGITREECTSKRCCFDDSLRGVHWCFHRPRNYECVADRPQDREECGYPGIPKAECESRRCCFNDAIPDVKWCFYGKYSNEVCDSSNPRNRYECGYAGIPQSTCLARGCCFDNRIVNTTWCFHKSRSPCPQQNERQNRNVEFEIQDNQSDAGSFPLSLHGFVSLVQQWFSKE